MRKTMVKGTATDKTPLLAEEGELKSPIVAEEGGVRQRAPEGARKRGKETLEVKVKAEDKEGRGEERVKRVPVMPPDPWWVTTLEAVALIFTVCFAYYAYYYFDHLHLNITHGYAKLGYPAAQHHIGQRYMHGKGVDKDQHHAMEWFKMASDQGHAHASYNLAVGHLQGIRTDMLDRGEPHKLIEHAANNGVKEARRVLNEVCSKGGCN